MDFLEKLKNFYADNLDDIKKWDVEDYMQAMIADVGYEINREWETPEEKAERFKADVELGNAELRE